MATAPVHVVHHEPGSVSFRRFAFVYAAPGAAALLAAAFLASVIHRLQAGRDPRAGAALAVILVAAGAASAPLLYLAWRRTQARATGVAGAAVMGMFVALAAVYLARAVDIIAFPADLLIWAESDFVNDILKLHVGYPIYTAQQLNQSFIYTPGAPALTAAIAWLIGRPSSLAAFRTIQLGYTIAAAVVSLGACRRVLRSLTGRFEPHPAWTAIALPFFLLVASNSLTNPFVVNLHNDALAQLLTVVTYAALIAYADSRHRGWLVLLAILPAAGFAVKQSLAAWAPLVIAYLLLFDARGSRRVLAAYAVASLAAVGATMVGGYAIWGAPFGYWVFGVLGRLQVSPLRSIEHALVVWPYVAAGLVGGSWLLRREPMRSPMTGVWLVWLALMALEIYTSGIAWMLNHIGPGSLLAAIWLFAAATDAWGRVLGAAPGRNAVAWRDAATAVALSAAACAGLAVVAIPVRPYPQDARRYVQAIESEVGRHPASRVLLDMGTWVYLDSGVVMTDRVATFGDRGLAGVGDFSGMRARLAAKQYDAVLVHNLHSPDLWYDHRLWAHSSGIRDTLLDNYEEVRVIPAVGDWTPRDTRPPYGLGDVSVLVPREGRTAQR